MFPGGYALIAYTQYDDDNWAVAWIEGVAYDPATFLDNADSTADDWTREDYLRVPPTTVPTRWLVAPLNRVPSYLN